jgi:hypothetical protein
MPGVVGQDVALGVPPRAERQFLAIGSSLVCLGMCSPGGDSHIPGRLVGHKNKSPDLAEDVVETVCDPVIHR